MKNVIITGASGMIGGIVLQHCLKDPQIGKVISFVRRPSGINHAQLLEIIIQDFNNYSGIEDHFKDIDIAYFCLGVYTGSVPDEKFKEITVDYTKAFADILKAQSPNSTFCFLSGQGADSLEKSRMSFARYKGIAENHLLKLKFKECYLFRPSYIYPVKKRKEPNFSYRLTRRLYPLIKLFGKSMSIKSTELGKVIFKIGINGTQKTILENKDLYNFL